MGGRLTLSTQMSKLLRDELFSASQHEREQSIEIRALQPLFEKQFQESIVPTPREFLIESFETSEGWHHVFYPFEGRFVHEAMGSLIGYRISLLQPISFSLAFNERRLADFREEPNLMKYLEKRPKDLSLWELTGLLSRVTAKDVPKVTTYEIRYFAIYANTLSCFIVVGLAVPFAVAGIRTNPLVGITKSFSLFFLFYIVSQLVYLVGERQLLDARTAAWLPSALMVLLSLYLYRKAV